MTIEDAKKHIKTLAQKSSDAKQSDDALRFSQSACNVANALCALGAAEKQK